MPLYALCDFSQYLSISLFLGESRALSNSIFFFHFLYLNIQPIYLRSKPFFNYFHLFFNQCNLPFEDSYASHPHFFHIHFQLYSSLELVGFILYPQLHIGLCLYNLFTTHLITFLKISYSLFLILTLQKLHL